MRCLIVVYLLMLSPSGGGGGDPGYMWGNWPLLPFPPSGIWLRTWVPRVGASAFLRGGIGPRHIVPCARLCTGHLGIEVARLKPWKTAVLIEVSICFYIYTKILLLTTHFQCKLMKHLTLWGLLIISTCFSSENQALEGGKDLIWPNFGAPWWVPPLRPNTDRCIIMTN